MIINDTQFAVDLSDILRELQSQLRINGSMLLKDMREVPDNIMVTCPYHKDGLERKPSAGIKKSDGTFHCFTCGETHTLPEMISYCFGYNDVVGTFGWNWLLKNFLTISIESRKDIPIDLDRNMLYNVTNDTSYVSETELDSYRYTHPYMYKRKLTDEIIEIFDIGFDSNTNCITFPIRQQDGRTVFVARRSVNSKYFNYPAGVVKPVYGLYELEKVARKEFHCLNLHIINVYPREVIICESMIDALTCWVYGRYAVALNGLGNDLQFKQLRDMSCRKFILATDMDEAGQKARKRIKANLKNKLVTEYIWDINIAKDINDMSKEYFDNLEEVF